MLVVINNLAKCIDHALLKPEATKQELHQLCVEASEHGFCSVCSDGSRVQDAVELSKTSSKVKVCAVIGFPLGACGTHIKVAEARDVTSNGADEIEMVMNIGKFKDGHSAGDCCHVFQDIKAVVDLAHEKIMLVNVTLETCPLERENEIENACMLCVRAGADFVKTSTGFDKTRATPEAMARMKKAVGDKAFAKATGGIQNHQTAVDFTKAGANRLGCSSSVAIVKGEESPGKQQSPGTHMLGWFFPVALFQQFLRGPLNLSMTTLSMGLCLAES